MTTAPIEFYDGASATEAPARNPVSASVLTEAVAELDAQLEGPEEPELPAERERTLRAPGFTRMPVAWSGEHASMTRSIEVMAAERIREDFADLFEIIKEIQSEARPIDRATGEIGAPDFSSLLESRKEHWVIQLSVMMFGWRQRATAYWGEAMFAKVVRQESFTEAYLGVSGRSTVEDRTQAGQRASLQDYYFAVLRALLHKHASEACATAELVCQRLKDFCAR